MIKQTIECATDSNDLCDLYPAKTVFALEFHGQIEVDDKRDFDLSIDTAKILREQLDLWITEQESNAK